MSFRSYREGSRTDWGTSKDGETLTIEQINCGALLRIADAVEKMAKPYTDALHAKECAERRAELANRAANSAIRRASALRGVITRMKRKAGAS